MSAFNNPVKFLSVPLWECLLYHSQGDDRDSHHPKSI